MSRTIGLSLVITSLLVAAAGGNARGQDASATRGTPAPSQGVLLGQVSDQTNGSPPSATQAKGAALPGASQNGNGQAASNAAQVGGQGAAATPPGGDSAAPGDTAAAKSSDHRKPVCFNLTGRCVGPVKGSSAATRAAGAAGATQTGDRGKSMDLAAPDVRTVVPADQLKEPLPNSEQITEVQESQTVAVKGEAPGPEVPLGFGAIWWALNHPSRAWKIFLPSE